MLKLTNFIERNFDFNARSIYLAVSKAIKLE